MNISKGASAEADPNTVRFHFPSLEKKQKIAFFKTKTKSLNFRKLTRLAEHVNDLLIYTKTLEFTLDQMTKEIYQLKNPPPTPPWYSRLFTLLRGKVGGNS